MGSVPPLLSFLLMVAAGWVNRHQLIVIEFLQAENQLLKQRLRGKRIRFTDAEPALLARKAKAVGPQSAAGVGHDRFRRHVNAMAPAPGRAQVELRRATRPWRPGIMREIAELIVRIGAGQSAMGLHENSGGAGQSPSPGRSRHDCQCTEALWH